MAEPEFPQFPTVNDAGFETKAIRLQAARGIHHEHSVPIFMTSSYFFDSAEEARALFADEMQGNIYSRYSNPNTDEFAAKLALLEGAEMGLSTATGMAAVNATVMGLLQSGDHLVSAKSVFGSTYGFFLNWLTRWGISVDTVEMTDLSAWEASIKPSTRMFYLETPTNPVLDIADLEALCKLAHAHNIIVVVDNCFASPYLQNPIKFGVDIVIHSATKYIDGQGRALGGGITGPKALLNDIKAYIRASGPSLSPFNAWLLSKSLETLAARMDRHCANALSLAKKIEQHKAISWLRYPGLESHPHYALAKKQMRGGGGIVSFELKGGVDAGRNFLDRLEMISLSANLGDSRSIATHPASTTHAKMPDEVRRPLGITPGLVRVSVGLESIEDIETDVLRALEGL